MTEKNVLSVQLLLANPVEVNREAYLAALQKYCGRTELAESKSEDFIHAWHFDYPLNLIQPTSVPIQSILSWSTKLINQEAFEAALQQSWSFPEAREVISRCHYEVFLSDLMGRGLDPVSRLSFFSNAVRAALEAIPGVLAFYWKTSECIIDPTQFLNACMDNAIFSAGPINVRLFNILEREAEIIMDTLGMEVFNLPDIQCHFKNLDASNVAQFLFNTAKYLLDYGNLIEGGQTIEGISPSQFWECQYQDALVAPHRVVLNVNTG